MMSFLLIEGDEVEYINPKERFSTRVNSISISEELLRSVAKCMQLEDSCLTITALSGGFMNANFLVRSSKGDFVFRVYSSDRVTAEREMDMLGHLEKFKVLAPLPIDLVEMNGCQIGVISYIEGETLEDVMLRKSTLKSDIFFKIGRHLAEIHKITFERTGFIGPKVNVGHQYENFGWFIKGFVRSTMEQLSDDRLDLSTRERVLKLVDDQWDKIVPQEQLKQLVHCDFNPKNIMVTRSGSLAAILDWEFCVSGNGLSDIANFFRFSYDYPTGSEDEFVAGYQSSGGLVPAKWCEAAKLLDLGNMCSFLERSEDSQKSFRTARVVVQSTLEQFGY